MMENPNPAELRQFYFDAWQKAKAKQILSPMENIIVDVIQRHPEYHALFDNADSFKEWQDERFQLNGNPFFHMGLHIAVIEQVSIDRPPGIKSIYQKLLRKLGDQTSAEHKMMDSLARCLVESFHNPELEHEMAYMEALRRIV